MRRQPSAGQNALAGDQSDVNYNQTETTADTACIKLASLQD